MADMVQVSVIIPVYNAERFLEEAVESVLRQKDDGVAEIILVEDGSTDGSLDKARSLVDTHGSLVRLLRHEGGGNRGVGASRNLGVANARHDVVCFLDADDYWLPGRLEGVQAVLPGRPDVDGVYDTVTTAFENEEEKKKYEACGLAVEAGPSDTVPPELLFDAFLDGRIGWHTNGIAVRRSAFLRVGGFNPGLRLRQDGELWFRMAAVLRLIRSPLRRPVAAYRRYGENRFDPSQRFDEPEKVKESESAVWNSLYEWMTSNELPPGTFDKFFWAYMMGLGRLGRLVDAWRAAVGHGMPWYFLFALRTALPGPRRVLKRIRYELSRLGRGWRSG